MALTVNVSCDPARWMDYRIEADDAVLVWQTENFRNSFEELLVAVADALKGQGGAVEFTDVPRAMRLTLEPSGDRLGLTLLSFDDWPILQSAVGEPVGALDVRLRTFAGAILAAGQKLAEDAQAYEKASRYPFPEKRLAELAEALKAR